MTFQHEKLYSVCLVRTCIAKYNLKVFVRRASLRVYVFSIVVDASYNLYLRDNLGLTGLYM